MKHLSILLLVILLGACSPDTDDTGTAIPKDNSATETTDNTQPINPVTPDTRSYPSDTGTQSSSSATGTQSSPSDTGAQSSQSDTGTQADPASPATGQDTSSRQSSQKKNAHNARTSLDYAGDYLPAENSPGNTIKQITIGKDGKIVIIMTDNTRVEGTYRWDETGSILHYGEGAKPDFSFFVGENYLKRVDANAGEEQTTFQKKQ